MLAAEEGAAARDAFRLEPQGLVGAARACVVGIKAEPHAPGVGLAEHRIDHLAKQRTAVALARSAHGHAFDERHALGRGPVARDPEIDRRQDAGLI